MKIFKGLDEKFLNPNSIKSDNKHLSICGCEVCKDRAKLYNAVVLIGSILLATVLLFGAMCGRVQASEPLTDNSIMTAALGEAIGEPAPGLEAVCRAIINRNSLKGVFGLRNPVVKKATAKDWIRVRVALERARTRDITGGATGWGNAGDLQQFKRKGWFKRCVITDKIGNHIFYREVRQ